MNQTINQKVLFESGNELAAYAAKQINYHVMGYYPITPSTQIAEQLDLMKSEGEHDILLMAAEGEHSAAGICYGASVGGGRVFNATSANGLLYALEQLPVQSGTRFPMVLNVACRSVSGPLDIKGDHSDIMYALNAGWIILFANSPQAVYDFNICALKIAETVKLPVIVAFDGFFTSHQKRRCEVLADDADVQAFIGEYHAEYTVLDPLHPVSVGSYMNEPDLANNKYQLYQAMEHSRIAISKIFAEYGELTGRVYDAVEMYGQEDAEVILLLLGSSYHTAKEAVDRYQKQGKKCAVITVRQMRPFPAEDLARMCASAHTIVVGDRQDSYGARGGNLSLELKAALQTARVSARVLSRIYGLGGQDFFVEDGLELLDLGYNPDADDFGYMHINPGMVTEKIKQFFDPLSEKKTAPGVIRISPDEFHGNVAIKGAQVRDTLEIPKRLAPGHGACPGCGIPVNINLLLRGIEGNVVLLFQTGCGMVVTTPYPKTAFKVSYVHNLFQNGAATLSGLVEMYYQRQKRGELPEGKITFIMVSGDGGMDIGMGSAIGAALRGNHFILLEYDNGGYMNTGYQLSYSTPQGAKSSTSHVGRYQYGKAFTHKDTAMIMAATGVPYVATVAESNPADFIKKASKAQYYANKDGMAYMKALSACPLNWGDKPNTEREVIAAAVDCCYHPLYEVEQGFTTLNYNPEDKNKKIPVLDWLTMMGRTKHLKRDEYKNLVNEIQYEIERRWNRLKARADHPLL